MLTNGEVKMVNKTFGNMPVNTDRVAILTGCSRTSQPVYDRPHVGFKRDDEGSMIFFPSDSYIPYSSDFSTFGMTLEQTYAFIHEMAHVWQYQRNIKFSVGGIVDGGHLTDRDLHRKMDTDPETLESTRDTIHPPKNWSKNWPDELSQPVVTKRRKRLSEVDSANINSFLRHFGKRPLTAAEIAAARDHFDNRFYNYTGHDLNCVQFSQLNEEEQADIIADYYILQTGGQPETIGWAVTSRPRPPLSAYRCVLPFVAAPEKDCTWTAPRRRPEISRPPPRDAKTIKRIRQ